MRINLDWQDIPPLVGCACAFLILATQDAHGWRDPDREWETGTVYDRAYSNYSADAFDARRDARLGIAPTGPVSPEYLLEYSETREQLRHDELIKLLEESR